MDPTTIAAIATATGSAGIGIVKISGPRAIAIAGALFHPSRAGTAWTHSHRLCHGHVKDPVGGHLVDEVLVGVMRAPSSYTGEDVVEINAHGGPALLARILELVLGSGACMAAPGEFTRRAFVNGRIDLTQAEAVIDIVTAKTALQQRNAALQLEGGLSIVVSGVRQALFDAIVDLEAAIDFPEDVGAIDPAALAKHLNANVLDPAQALGDSYDNGRIIREGVRLALVGRPNVGKSSLLNRLLGTDRVIVTPFPGTTRDVIEETILIDGVTLVLADTAGLRPSTDPIESIGMARTLAHIQRCDLVLMIVEAGAVGPDAALIGQVHEKPIIVVINKIDLVDDKALAKTSACWHNYPMAKVSALTGAGIDALKATIGKTVLGPQVAEPDRIVPAIRHKRAIARILDHCRAATHGLETGLPPELVAIDLQAARVAADEVLGIEASPEVLDEIFGRFCIGK